MSMPNPSDESPTEVAQTDPLETPAQDVLAAPNVESPATPPSPPPLSYEDQLAQSPYSTSREPSPPPPPISDPATVIPSPQLSTPVSPSPYAPPAPPHSALEAPIVPQPPPAPSPYAPTTPPYQPGGVAPPVYTQQPYSQYQPYAQPQSASSNAVAALVCGILGWTLCAPCALAAAFIGFAEVKRIDRGEAPREGRGMALWGAWLGAVMSSLVGIILLIYGAIFVFALIAAVSSS
jgi:hypothetical protein